MRKPKPINEELLNVTALDKAQRELKQALELNEMREKKAEIRSMMGRDSMEGDVAEFIEQKAGSENGGVKSLYGYSAELSRSSKIENSIDDIEDEEKKRFIEKLLGSQKVDKLKEKAEKEKILETLLTDHTFEDVKHEIEAKEAKEVKKSDVDISSIPFEELTEEHLVSDLSLLDGEFHDGIDSLTEIGNVNIALKKTDKMATAQKLINESFEYEVKSFSDSEDKGKKTFSKEPEEPQNNEAVAEEFAPAEFVLSSFGDEDDDIVPYDINEALLLGEVIPPARFEEELAPEYEVEEEPEPEEILPTPEELLTEAQLQVDQMIADAKREAESILLNAKAEAENIKTTTAERAEKLLEERVEEATELAKEEGYAEGFEKGQKEGYTEAQNAVNKGMIEEANAFGKELQRNLEEFRKKQDDFLEEYVDGLTDLALSVAEKIIKISLKSSKDVVSKMIVAAAEDCRNKEWAKVYISNADREIAINLEKELLDALNQISENVKVIIMDDEPSGTCIIESPDQIVDSSVDVQLENIRQIVNDNKR